MSKIKGPFLLCILDGFGLSEKQEGNAIKAANTPFIDDLLQKYPHSKLYTHGKYVGLPEGQMGNSEVGHMTIGSGRIILQNLDRIRQSFANNEIQQTETWKTLVGACKESRAVHVFALVSNGGVHSHTDHIIELCKNLSHTGKHVLVHAITDGRDTTPFCAKEQIDILHESIQELSNVHLASISGRFYAMDRDNRWERVAEAYKVFTSPEKGTEAYAQVIQKAHKQEVTDEFILPTKLAINEDIETNVQADDTLVFANFRADRMRQLVKTFMQDVKELTCPKVFPKHLFSMTEYDATYADKVHALFPPEQPTNTIGEVISKHGGKQLRIAESEKYAHVTFFLNGGREEPFANEDRIVIPSPKVKTYDLAPAMSLPEVTENLISAVNDNDYELIVLNIANGDQVGHSGVFEACIETVEHIDKALSKITPIITAKGGEIIIIADHGNCEEMFDAHGEMLTSHTTNPVPLLYVGRPAEVSEGGLADVAPTILSLLGHSIPEEMSGTPLVRVLGGEE